MLASSTEILTRKADSYLRQMCKHFAHKADVRQVEDTHVIRFGFGTGKLRATDDRIVLCAHAEDRQLLEQVETVLGSHLERFAFRENLNVTWPRP
ncbi:DUF2218 domain-containing protein [Ruegeria atlantica]|uniref:DUF2218 domain-containing protein n=1 Tax=Ruegeria atlantica TaxID=81569 RepID=UPI00147DA7EA|nr:DUF2218 domain-containing protein [Ruegeria atlantica]